MNKTIGLTTDAYQQKIVECFEVVQNQIETSFNKIYSYLDSLLNNTSDLLNIKTFENQPCAPNFDLPKAKFENTNFSQQLCQDVQPLIKHNLSNQIILKDQSLNETQTNKEIQSLTNKSNMKPFIYQLISQYSIKQFEWCCAITINKDCTTLLAGCDKQIKVYEFKQGMAKQTQILSEHKSRVYTLNFMKKSNQFISGSCDKSIIIWQQNQNNQWISQYILNGHTNIVYCLILNNNEDLIVSGSDDKSIKFWMKNNQWMCQQTITDHTNEIFGLSFNQQSNRIVSCGGDKLILIMEEQGQNKQWVVIQKITVEQYGFRVCFIDNNMFALSNVTKNRYLFLR
ncbi:unnamed protein product [Paramecium octaurelia]|uniref:WD domain, G-beta repeat protein n=1 Tax=Paramecium octaurelia TaxID=43137 RepID=A0A8S1X9H0_PAROT|nr:unnamed protein product [Paramecium octaurelia]